MKKNLVIYINQNYFIFQIFLKILFNNIYLLYNKTEYYIE